MIVLNGSTASGEGMAEGIGGGDQVILKFMRLSGFIPDLIVPSSAKNLFVPHARLFLTKKVLGGGLLPMLWLYLVRTIQGMCRALQSRHRYDIVLAASAIVVDLLPLWLTRGKKKGVVIYHLLPDRKGINLETKIRFWLAAREQKLAMCLVGLSCDFVVAGNAETRRQLRTLFPAKEVVILHAGFDAAAIDRSPVLEKDQNLACFMGRLTSQKGIFDLIEIMIAINRIEPDFRLVMMGSGPEKEALQREIDRRGLRSIQLKGFVSDEAKYAELRRSAYFFFPSYEEGWGIALAEALYCQARCICYELPHYRNIFGDFPIYSELGNTAGFVKRFFETRPLPSREEQMVAGRAQANFIMRYHDPCVVQEMVGHLKHFASCRTNG